MHFCYVDDSGAANGRTLTGLLIPAENWGDLLAPWLNVRKKLQRDHQIGLDRELKGSEMAKGRGSYSSDEDISARIRRTSVTRYCDMLRSLLRIPGLQIITVGYPHANLTLAYRAFVEQLEDWAAVTGDQVLIFLDGNAHPQDIPQGEGGRKVATELRDAAVRDAAPYRHVHRQLPLETRRVLEDPIMQDSKTSHLIQAADLAAYAAFQYIRHRDMAHDVTFPGAYVEEISNAYEKLREAWITQPNFRDGILWSDPFENEHELLHGELEPTLAKGDSNAPRRKNRSRRKNRNR